MQQSHEESFSAGLYSKNCERTLMTSYKPTQRNKYTSLHFDNIPDSFEDYLYSPGSSSTIGKRLRSHSFQLLSLNMSCSYT